LRVGNVSLGSEALFCYFAGQPPRGGKLEHQGEEEQTVAIEQKHLFINMRGRR